MGEIVNYKNVWILGLKMVSRRREIPLLRIFLAFLIATFLFLSGFLVGYSVSYLKYQNIALRQDEIKYDLLSLDLESKFLESCDKSIFQSISTRLDEMGKMLNILEDRFGKLDEKVIEQKKRYTLLEIQHFLNVKKYKKQCKQNISVILFFYSNIKPYDNMGERMGYILNAIKVRNPEKVMIYSIDYDLKMGIIDILKNVYNITSPNTLIINEKIKLESVENIREIEKYLD